MGKTTLILDDHTLQRLRVAARAEGLSMSEYAEAAIRRQLDVVDASGDLPPLPSWDLGPFPVDVADRAALDDWMDAHDLERSVAGGS